MLCVSRVFPSPESRFLFGLEASSRNKNKNMTHNKNKNKNKRTQQDRNNNSGYGTIQKHKNDKIGLDVTRYASYALATNNARHYQART